MSQCDAFGLLPAEAAGEVAVVVEVVNSWQKHFAQAGVTARDIESLAERIDGEELLSQRIGFDRAQFQSPPARRKRPGHSGAHKLAQVRVDQEGIGVLVHVSGCGLCVREWRLPRRNPA